MDEPQPQGLCCLEVAFTQVAVRSSPSRDSMALSYKRKGELIFARSQNFSGWLRLAGAVKFLLKGGLKGSGRRFSTGFRWFRVDFSVERAMFGSD